MLGNVLIGNSLSYNNTALTYIGLNVLTYCGGSFSVAYNAVLTWVLPYTWRVLLSRALQGDVAAGDHGDRRGSGTVKQQCPVVPVCAGTGQDRLRAALFRLAVCVHALWPSHALMRPQTSWSRATC